MIDLISGFDNDVVAADCSGHITKSDYENVLIPAVEAKLKTHEKLKLFYRAGPKFEGMDAGAIIDDAKLGFAHLSRWKRAAVVTDIEWFRLSMKAFAFLMPCPVRVFAVAEEAEARRWIAQ